MRGPARRAGALACVLLAGGTAWVGLRGHTKDGDIGQRLQQRMALNPDAAAVPCRQPGQLAPVVLLVLGQSNAGNHGEAAPRLERSPITLVRDGGCVQTTDPLPGATGRGRSIWAGLPEALRQEGFGRPALFSVLAVDATTIAEWVTPGSPLRDALASQAAMLARQGHAPDLVLWQQGEADARAGTSTSDYAQRLSALVDILHAAGVRAPLVVGHSTACRSTQPLDAVRNARQQALLADARLRPGPDFDHHVRPSMRHDGCHFSHQGLAVAAGLWARTIVSLTSSNPGLPPDQAPAGRTKSQPS